MANISLSGIQLAMAIIRYQETGVLSEKLEGIDEADLQKLLVGPIDVVAQENRTSTVLVRGKRPIGFLVKRNGDRKLYR